MRRRRSVLVATGGLALTPVKDIPMNNLIYIVGLVVVVIAVLSFLGLH
jgi:hypothetical protein